MLPLDEVRIDPVMVNNIGLRKSIYTRSSWRSLPGFKTAREPGKRTWQKQQK
jgi:hypothetical protein